MSISRMNKIGLEKGLDAAIIYAKVAMIPYPIRKKLEAGVWVFGKQPKQAKAVKPTSVPKHVVVDRHGDKRIIKSTLASEVLGYSVETLGESGKVVSTEGLGKLSLNEARAMIGKVIAHPIKMGGKTNNPAVSQGMKGQKGK